METRITTAIHYEGDEIKGIVYPKKGTDPADYDLFTVEIGRATLYVRTENLHAFKSQMGHALKALKVPPSV